MVDRWQEFIARTSTSLPDDPFVRLLREKLTLGSQLIRVNFLEAGAAPEYLVLLATQKVLHEMRIPHSPAFTRWSLEAGARLETPQEEARRFGLLVAERLTSIAREVGRDYFDSVLVTRLRELGPANTVDKLADHHVAKPHAGSQLHRVVSEIDTVIGQLATALRDSLHYSPEEAASILDEALASWLDERFHITEGKLLFPR